MGLVGFVAGSCDYHKGYPLHASSSMFCLFSPDIWNVETLDSLILDLSWFTSSNSFIGHLSQHKVPPLSMLADWKQHRDHIHMGITTCSLPTSVFFWRYLIYVPIVSTPPISFLTLRYWSQSRRLALTSNFPRWMRVLDAYLSPPIHFWALQHELWI